MNKDFIIGLDVDNVLLDTNRAVIARIDKEFGVEIDFDSTEYGFTNVEPELHHRIHELFNDPEFMATIPFYEGALEFVEQLNELGTVVFITSVYTNVASQRIMLLNHFFPSNAYVITGRKELVNVDLLIDDHLLHHERLNNPSKSIVMAQPYNKTSLFRTNNYDEVIKEVKRRKLIKKHTKKGEL